MAKLTLPADEGGTGAVGGSATATSDAIGTGRELFRFQETRQVGAFFLG
jgi:hypothetical protein